MKEFLAKYFAKIILLNYDKIAASDWIRFSTLSVMKVSIVGIFLKTAGLWFKDNAQFISFMLLAILINAGLGMVRHLFFTKSFKWINFFKKTGVMLLVIVSVYPVLDMITVLAGSNIATDIFRITIQVATFLYPASKILKNGYIISGEKYPPKWLMERLYNFEKTGNINEILKHEKTNNDDFGNADGY